MDALRSTLEKHPGIQIQKEQVRVNEGILRASAGQFDTTVNANISQSRTYTPLTPLQQFQYGQLGLSISSITANSTTYTLGAQKLFRNGIAIGPAVTLTRNTDDLATRVGLNESDISFQVLLPFLRGRGRAAVDAQEQSSESLVNASLNDTNETIAQLLANTAISYWNAIAAAKYLQIAKDSEDRGAKYVRDVRTLIEADKVPRGELYQLLANLNGRTASRITAEQQVISAQQNLALAMGLKPDEIVVSPDPSDPFPAWPEKAVPELSPQIVQKFVKSAVDKRPDLIAAKLRRQSAEQMLPAARNQLRPQLNLTINVGYSGLRDGTSFWNTFGAPFNNVHGMNAYGSLNFAFPPRNNAAIGQLTQADASYRQSILNETDLERNIASNVVSAITTLSTSIAALQRTEEAVMNYRVALDNELERFRLGLNSLVDVLTMEDRLTSALSQEVSARLNYAVAIANLRLATGTIVDPSQRTQTIRANTFLQPPLVSEMQ